MATPSNTRYLNREGKWLDFRHRGLELRPDGALQLESLPELGHAPPAGLPGLEAPAGPAGVAELPSGDVVSSDPDTHRLMLVEACDGTQRPASCLRGPGPGPDELRAPRGLLHHRGRGALLVADRGNHRIQVLALPGFELSETWDGAGTLQAPQSLAADAAGNVYVADGETGRVHKLDPLLGEPVAGFWESATAGGALTVVEVAVHREVVYLLSPDGRITMVDTDGRVRRWFDTGAARPMGLAASGERLVVGDNATRRLRVFRLDGTAVGDAGGFSGPVAAVAPAGGGGLLVHPGDACTPLRLSATGAYRTQGVLWGGPFRNPSSRSEPRHLLRAAVTGIGAAAHVQLHVIASPDPTPPAGWPHPADPFADPRWQRLPIAPDAAETLFQGAVGDVVWLGLTFAGDGTASPVLEQIRIDFDHETYLQYLPALYEREAAPADVLARWLTLFESAFDAQQADIEALPRLFDPAAAPAEWLPWLAGWLALELPDAWDDDRRRAAIARAFGDSALRGTAAGLRAAVKRSAGVDCVIDEPILAMHWWALPGAGASPAETALSVLGVTTTLAAGEAQGAVAGTTAVLDGSFVAAQEDYATPLFDDVAHQFTVLVHRGAACGDEAVARVRDVLDRERPAHTTYHLCVVEPCLRVGLQARIGIDAVIAGPAQPSRLGDGEAQALVLGGTPAGRLGEQTVGETQLTDG